MKIDWSKPGNWMFIMLVQYIIIASIKLPSMYEWGYTEEEFGAFVLYSCCTVFVMCWLVYQKVTNKPI